MIRRSKGGGIVPAACSWFIPGLGQLVNGDSNKALGVFAVCAAAGLATQLPIIGGIAAVVAGGSWIYGIANAYTGNR